MHHGNDTYPLVLVRRVQELHWTMCKLDDMRCRYQPTCGLAFADVEGELDLNLAISPTFVSIMLNDGSGTLSNPLLYGVSRFPGDIKFGDLDADGDLDPAVTNRTQESVSVLLNQCTPKD